MATFNAPTGLYRISREAVFALFCAAGFGIGVAL